MQTANLLEFGSGGGLYGDDRDVVLNNWRFEEHSFEKLAEDKKTVVERFPPGCHLGVDIYAEDRTPEEPEFVTQWYPLGDLPAARMQELGFQPRPTPAGQRPQLGGYRPSTDGDNPAPSGPFVVLDGRNDIWNGCPYAQLMDEFKALGIGKISQQLLAQGVAALNGIRVHLGQKALPKSKRTQQEEKLSGQTKDARTILVPVRINAWPGEAAQNVATQPTAAAPRPVAVASQPTAAAPTPTAAAPAGNGGAGNGADLDEQAVKIMQAALKAKGGFITKKDLGVALMPFLAKEGDKRMPLMQRTHQTDFLQQHSGSAWIFDPATETIGLMPA